MRYDDSVILLFAKAPVAGKVNTRLIDDIGIEAATKLQYDLIHQRLSMLDVAGLCDVWLMCSPDCQHETFQQRAGQYQISTQDQAGADLGERMFNGVKTALLQYRYCVVIGTDAPALDAAQIEQSLVALHDGSEVVIVPAEDGGYVLIAMQRARGCLFEGIRWGSADVMQQTTGRLEKNNLSNLLLSTCWDVDRLEDYQRYLKLSAAS